MDEKEALIVVDESFQDERIDKLISNIYEDITRSRVQKLIKAGRVKINDKVVPNNHFQCNEGDIINIDFPEPEKIDIVPESLPLDIIYDDDDIIIVNKSQGMVVHPSAGHFEGTLVNGLMYLYGDSLSGINGKLRPGIVHRIDMDTSGILVVCKNNKAHNFIAELLSRHDINRIYYCICHGIFKDKEGVVDAPIGRSQSDRKKMAINRNNGKNAITHYKVLEELKGKYSLVECKLETGRTHQIRVHLTSLGHPLLGDKIYGSLKSDYSNLPGQMLHAGVLGFVHPTSKKYIEFRCPLPELFEQTYKKISNSDFHIMNELQSYLQSKINN
jgi:23S rRNA pseudouridine1911/1915/1917 synthase